jgi:excisionase family DNA binding protein
MAPDSDITPTEVNAPEKVAFPNQPWLNVKAAAAYVGVSTDTIYTACERGELRHARLSGRRSIRVRPEWIDEWLERHIREPQCP